MNKAVTRGAGVAAVSSLLALTACGGDDGGEAQPNAWVLSGGVWPVVEEDFADFSEENPEQAFTVESYANDVYKERIRTAVGSGDAPTLIVGWTGGQLVEYVEGEHVIDLTEQTADLQERLIDSVAANGEVDGSTYAVPMNNVQPVMLYYNEAVLNEVGLEVPTTYEEMLNAVEVLNENDIIPFALAGGSTWPNLMWVSYLVDRVAGPEPFEAVAAGEPDAWSHPGIIEGLERAQELIEAGAFDEDFASTVADQNEDAHLVADGRAAMVVQGSWVYSRLLEERPDFVESGDLGFTTFPTVDGGDGDPTNLVGNPANFWSVAASASEEEQQAATDYLSEHLFNDDYVDQMLDTGNIPPLEDLDEEIAEADDPEFLDFTYNMVRDADNFQLSWDQAVHPSQAQDLLDNMDALFRLDITPEEFAEAMNATQPGA